MNFEVGDKVKVCANPLDMNIGVIVRIQPSILDVAKLVYLVEAPNNFRAWFDGQSLKLILCKPEKVIFI